MMNMQRFSLRLCFALFVSIWLVACSDDSNTQDVSEVIGPVAFESGDACHVCGMIITEHPGAKGQITESRSKTTHKFCSTQDMLSWWLQPENEHLKAEIYVHDIAQTPWDKPQDEYLIDARDAWFVIGSDLQGAMGPALATFGNREAADSIVESNGGRVLSWDQLDLAVLQELAAAGHEHAASHAEQLMQEHGVVEEDNEPLEDKVQEHNEHSEH